MTNFPGSLRNIGIGVEATKGTAVTPDYWVPIIGGSVIPLVEYAEDDSNFGRLEGPAGADDVSEDAIIKFNANIRTDWFGSVCAQLFGDASSANVETTAYDHTFTFGNTVANNTLSIAQKDPNADEVAVYSMLNSMNLSCNAKGLVQGEFEFMGKQLASDSNTASYSRDHRFNGPEVSIKFGAAITNLSGASAVGFHSFNINFNTNLLGHHVFGSKTADKFLQQSLTIEGELELLHTDNTYRDYFTDGTLTAMQIQMVGAGTVGAVSNPTITIQLAEVSFQSWEVSEGNRDIAIETIGFKAHYDPTESTPQMGNIVIRNDEDGTTYQA